MMKILALKDKEIRLISNFIEKELSVERGKRYKNELYFLYDKINGFAYDSDLGFQHHG